MTNKFRPIKTYFYSTGPTLTYCLLRAPQIQYLVLSQTAHLLSYLGTVFVSFTCGIQLIHIINREWRKMKYPHLKKKRKSVYGNMRNNNTAISYRRLNSRHKRAQTCGNLVPVKNPVGVIVGHEAWESPVTRGGDEPSVKLSSCVKIQPRAYYTVHVCKTSPSTTQPLFLLAK